MLAPILFSSMNINGLRKWFDGWSNNSSVGGCGGTRTPCCELWLQRRPLRPRSSIGFIDACNDQELHHAE